MNLRLLNGHAAASYRWIRARLDEDGGWRGYPERDVGAYFKAPLSFHATGDRPAAELCLAHVERVYLRPDGGVDHIRNPKLIGRHPLYPHAHLALAAARIGRPETAERILGFLARHRHAGLEAWGRLAGEGPPAACDSVSTATIGLACLENGRPEEACGAARFLARLLELQPRPESEFLNTVLDSGELWTGADDAPLFREQRIDLRGRLQAWTGLAFPLAFLARLFERSGDGQWLALARRYLELLERSPQAWQDLSSGKAAWACAVLYRATGERAFRSRALRAARALVSRMAADGCWHACIDGEGGTRAAPNAMGYEASAEFALWLALVGEALASRDGLAWTPPARFGDEPLLARSLRQLQRIALHRARTTSFRWHRAMSRAR